jgi:hypothetical protein
VTAPSADRTLDLVARVADVLAREGVGCAVIGSVALAAHGYVRATRDVDLAVLVPPSPVLAALAAALRGEGLTVEHVAPAPDDDLGGVVTVTASGADPVQIVNFFNPPYATGALIRAALAAAVSMAGLPARVVDLPHLVALKLATGAFRDEVDVGELRAARRHAPLAEVRAVCARHRLEPALDRVLARVPR